MTTQSMPDLTSSAGVLLVTNKEQTPGESSGFEFAAAVAASGGVPVTLYDRSEETWADSQHPEGPLLAGDKRLADRPELTRQIEWLESHQVTGQGWVATLPSIGAVISALSEVHADVVVVPSELGRNLFEKALEGGSLAESLREQIGRQPHLSASVVEIDADGHAAMIEAG